MGDKYGGRKRMSGFMRIVDAVVLLFTVVFTLLLLCAYLARYVNPASVWFFALAGLGAPVLYVANIVFALYWTIRWRGFAFIPLAALLVGAGWVSLFFRPSLSKHYTSEKGRHAVVMTYNVAGFLSGYGSDNVVSTLDSVAALTGRIAPDILCIQEYQRNTAERQNYIDSLFPLPYKTINLTIPNADGGGWGLSVYSRYAIVDSGVVDFGKSTNSAMWVDLRVKNDTIRVFNCHLQTTSVDHSDMEYLIRQEYLDGDDGEERVRSIASKLKRNFKVRASQVDSLAPMIERSPYRVIVCGDFNDPPMSYTYRKMRGELKDAFVEKGSGIPNTYRGLFNLFRIDYILHSKDIPVMDYRTVSCDFSDHKAVVVGFDFDRIRR